MRPLSLIIPVLNEMTTLPSLMSNLRTLQNEVQILFVDNGSHDGSFQLIAQSGFDFIREPRPGYGAAIKSGIQVAKNTDIAICDADQTYSYDELMALHDHLQQKGLDLVVGSRFRGQIQAGAMPWLHRYVGNPFFSLAASMMTSSRTTDALSGLRVFRRDVVNDWSDLSDDLDFSLHLTLKALRDRKKYGELPVSYRKSLPGRRSHLKTWRHGFIALETLLRELTASSERAKLAPLAVRRRP